MTDNPAVQTKPSKTPRAGCIVAVILVALLLGYCVHRAHSWRVEKDEPDQLDLAKITALLNVPTDSTFEVLKFSYIFLSGGPDSYGSCAFTIKHSPNLPPWNELLKDWTPLQEAPKISTSRAVLIPWMWDELSGLAYSDNQGTWYKRTVTASRSYERRGQYRSWKSPVECIAFFKPGTTDTLYVSVDGWLFQPDAVAMVTATDQATTSSGIAQ